MLEHVYEDTFREASNEFGPRVHTGPIRRRTATRSAFPPRDSSAAQRTEAQLIAHLGSHTACVNGIAVSPDHTFFVSCSDDKTVKVWDTARLERNITSKPRYSYVQHHGRVTCVCIVEASHCFVSAADDGTLHVVRVHVATNSSLPKYTKIHAIREHQMDTPGEYVTCMLHYNTGKLRSENYPQQLDNSLCFNSCVRRYGVKFDLCNDSLVGYHHGPSYHAHCAKDGEPSSFWTCHFHLPRSTASVAHHGDVLWGAYSLGPPFRSSASQLECGFISLDQAVRSLLAADTSVRHAPYNGQRQMGNGRTRRAWTS